VRSTTFLFTALCTSIQLFGVTRVQTGTQENITAAPAPRRAVPPRRLCCALPEAAPSLGRPRHVTPGAPRHATCRSHTRRSSVRRRPDVRVPETPPLARWTRAGARIDYKGPVALASTRRSSPPLRRARRHLPVRRRRSRHPQAG
jgi:hypothetical protein